MKFICRECKNVFSPEDISMWEESRNYWGEHCPEYMSGCPECKGGYEEAAECELCGKYTYKTDNFGGVCEECIEEYRHNLNVCENISRIEPKRTININPLLYSLLGDEEEIETVLWEYVRNQIDVDCIEYINEDISWFGEKLVKEVKRNEKAKD